MYFISRNRGLALSKLAQQHNRIASNLDIEERKEKKRGRQRRVENKKKKKKCTVKRAAAAAES